MATQSHSKTPTGIRRLGADFVSVLLTGETITAGNISVTAKHALTDADVSGTIIVPSSPELSGASIIRAQFQAGTLGDTYVVTLSTGTTSLGNVYDSTFNLIITATPETDNLLADRDEVKRLLQITDTSDDLLLDDLLRSASAYIRSRTQQPFTLDRYVETVRLTDAHSQTHCRVTHFPLLRVEQIVWKDEEGTVLETITDQTTYKWSFSEDGWLFFTDGTHFPRWPGSVEVTYRAGYAEIPSDVREACKRVVAVFYRQIGREGLLSEKIGDYAYRAQSLQDLPPALQRELGDGYIEGVIQRYHAHDLIVP